MENARAEMDVTCTKCVFPFSVILRTFSQKLSKKWQQGQRNIFGERINRGAKHAEFNADFKSVEKIGNIRKNISEKIFDISDKSRKSQFLMIFSHNFIRRFLRRCLTDSKLA
jgi:hypothetical protein